ncbi:MAG: ScpA family protein [Rhodospirillaceae bacterium]
MAKAKPFVEDVREPEAGTINAEQLVLALDGFEGPIDLLLTLARDQKVDLTRISILQLANQYLDFVAAARRVRIELAADYLVMAAWLAYLKSRLLLPEPEGTDEEPAGADLAAALAFQLRRLEVMREMGAKLIARPRLGRDRFPRGAPEGLAIEKNAVFQVTLYDLLKAYGEHRQREEAATLTIRPIDLYSLDEALQRLNELLGELPDWATLASFLPARSSNSLLGRSALAAHFAATLELVKAGRIEVRQDGAFAPLWLRRALSDR